MKVLQLEARQVDIRALSKPKTFTFADGKTIKVQVRRVLRGSFDVRGRFSPVGTFENECVVYGTLIFAEDGRDEKEPRNFEVVLESSDAHDFVSTVVSLREYLGLNRKPQDFVPSEYVTTLHSKIVVTVVQESPQRIYDRWEISLGSRKAVLNDPDGSLLMQIKDAVAQCAHWQPERNAIGAA